MRRIRRLLFAPECLMLLCSGAFRVIGNPVPDDAILKQVTIDPMGGWVQLFIESAEFDDVQPGEIPPIHRSPIISRTEA